MLEWIIEHPAGLPVLMKPLSGHRSDVKEFGRVVSEHSAQLQTTYGPTDLVADSTLSSEAHLQQFANTQLTWMTRVPATLSDAPAGLRQADPQTMPPLADGSRDRVGPSPAGGLAPRWGLIDAAPRQPHAQPPVDQPWLQHGDTAVHTWKTRCRTTVACEAEAPPALATLAPR